MRKALSRMSTLHNIAVCMLVSTYYIMCYVTACWRTNWKKCNDYHSMKVHTPEVHNQLSLKYQKIFRLKFQYDFLLLVASTLGCCALKKCFFWKSYLINGSYVCYCCKSFNLLSYNIVNIPLVKMAKFIIFCPIFKKNATGPIRLKNWWTVISLK